MHKLYILIKDGMAVGLQAAQGTHAAVQYVLDNPNQTWNNDTLVLLECNNLRKYTKKIKYSGLEYTEFREPNQDNIVTSIAVYAETNIFKKLPLIGT